MIGPLVQVSRLVGAHWYGYPYWWVLILAAVLVSPLVRLSGLVGAQRYSCRDWSSGTGVLIGGCSLI